MVLVNYGVGHCSAAAQRSPRGDLTDTHAQNPKRKPNFPSAPGQGNGWREQVPWQQRVQRNSAETSRGTQYIPHTGQATFTPSGLCKQLRSSRPGQGQSNTPFYIRTILLAHHLFLGSSTLFPPLPTLSSILFPQPFPHWPFNGHRLPSRLKQANL